MKRIIAAAFVLTLAFSGASRAATEVVPPNGGGTDASANAPALLTSLLAAFPVFTPGQYSIENDSASTVQYLLCPAVASQPANAAAATAAGCTIRLLAGTAANTPGQNTEPPVEWFVGMIYVLGSSPSQQVAARHN